MKIRGFLLLKQRDFKYLFEIVPSKPLCLHIGLLNKREAADRPKHPRRLRGQLKIIFLIEYRKKA